MPEAGTTDPSHRIQQLERDLEAANEALRQLKTSDSSSRLRRGSQPSLPELDIEAAQESVSNRLARQIDQMKRERGELCYQVEAEEEFLVNSLQRQLERVQKEKIQLENALEHEQESLVNRMRGLELPLSTSGAGSVDGSSRLGPALTGASRCSSVLSAPLSPELNREADLIASVANLESENFRLLTENLRLSQLLRRHGISPNTSVAIPLRRCDSNASDQSNSRSGSISDLRHLSGRHCDSEDEGAGGDSAINTANISPFRPRQQ